ncbi:glycosyltransferase family protein [Paenibacillus chungangensis]|uniref:Glycosyltransferase n=1 Tax=Paenibacillus chungangensis TaxID=696535 RepID=A0ABW3HLF1_9BACL
MNLLVLVKKFAERMPKHQHKYDMLTAIEKEANVMYWHTDGHIRDILARLPLQPDFIFHYDIEWRNAFAPIITGLDKVNIAKGCYVLDIHFHPLQRREYFNKRAKPDLIFSASKYPFLRAYPECLSRFQWMPFSINPTIIRDYGLPKNMAYSLTGMVNERYPFREAVKREMSGIDGFQQFNHPGHKTPYEPGMFINDKYATALNRSKLSFTCGSVGQIPVAKFFEIPGCRSLLLAEPNADVEELGFKDGEHYAACTSHNVRERALYYNEHEEERRMLTDKGYSLVHRHHSNAVRAKQFIAMIEQFIGSN